MADACQPEFRSHAAAMVPRRMRVCSSMLFAFSLSLLPCFAQSKDSPTAGQLSDLIEQNHRLEALLRAQQKTIDELKESVARLDRAAVPSAKPNDLTGGEPIDLPNSSPRGMAQQIRLSGEAGFAFFRSGPKGQFPNSEFRVDEARLFIDASVWKNLYFYSEYDLYQRETGSGASVGELYADFENVSGLWGVDNLLNIRVGRFYTPFGEEYQKRNVVENSLITHSVSDIWGFDNGIEIYGDYDRFHYVAAVQNGSLNDVRDYTSDKAVIGRVSFDAMPWLQLSASAMRTGDVAVTGDDYTAIWFSNGFYRSLGAAATKHRTLLYEADANAHWKTGHVSGFGGVANFNDNDPTGRDSRRLTYFSIEGVQSLTDHLYAAGRYGETSAPRGYPLAGLGNSGNYFYAGQLTDRLRRASLGVGYRFGPPVVLKFEYAYERGRLLNGNERNHEDLWATELGVKF